MQRHIPNSTSGFTLVEMAIVIVIIGIVMLTVFPALDAVRKANERALTQSNLRSLMLATAAYVQANGCLPCPANPVTNSTNYVNFGKVGTTNNVACGACAGTAAEGIPPFASLGIPLSTAHDGWGYWITMRVDPALTTIPTNSPNCGTTNTCSVFIPPTALCNTTDLNAGACISAPCTVATVANGSCNPIQTGQINTSDKGLCRNGLSQSAGAIPISVTTPGGATQKAAVIFVSHGKDGYGSFFAQAAANPNNGYRLPFTSNYAACSASGGYAQCNAAGTAQFYDAPQLISNTDTYDDILAYADRNTLVSMLGNPGCQTVW